MALRPEGPYRGGLWIGNRPLPCHHPGQRVHDLNVAGFLLTGKEKTVWGDAGYQGIEERLPEEEVEFRIAMRKGKRKLLDKDSDQERAEQAKSSMRARVEHPFYDLKRLVRLREGQVPRALQEHPAPAAAGRAIQPAAGRKAAGGVTCPGIIAPKTG